MLAPLVAFLATMNQAPSSSLADFVAKPQPAFGWKRVAKDEFELISQTWQGRDWHHDVLMQQPSGAPSIKGLAYLVVTGDRVDRVDVPFGQKLANASRLPVVTLFNVPNQPLFDLREDDLIAYSFEKYIETGSTDWPLLFPMVNSVVKAMDMVEKESHGAIHRFIVTGESKRGWTSWLVGALNDKRVIGIAPVAFDNLNFAAQLAHQMESWGHLSEMLGSYSGSGLIDEAKTEQGKALIQMVDPYAYLDHFHVPVLVIRGSNDRYWTADATSLYWDKILAPKAIRILPNEGHDFQNDDDYIQALGRFPEQCLRKTLQTFLWSGEGGITLKEIESIRAIKSWNSSSKTLDFRDSHWRSVSLAVKGRPITHYYSRTSSQQNQGWFLEVELKDGSRFTTPILIQPGQHS
ncbi:MAG TPA: PhoPQ-activated protein PqaA family protein [Fimbriimonadaceae bacterium]|jgi:PhoPQ-activated pathogenicity-related protein